MIRLLAPSCLSVLFVVGEKSGRARVGYQNAVVCTRNSWHVKMGLFCLGNSHTTFTYYNVSNKKESHQHACIWLNANDHVRLIEQNDNKIFSTRISTSTKN